MTVHASSVNSVAISPDGRYAASGSGNLSVSPGESLVSLWDLQTGEELARIDAHTNTITNVLFGPDGHSLFSSSWDGKLCTWDMDLLLAGQRP